MVKPPNVAHHPPQITSALYRSTFGGRCAWALLGCDRLLQGIYEHGAFPKIYRWSIRSCSGERTLQDRRSHLT
ncbi:MAG: hypothetical protein MJA27_33815 [Pseudanabaenales cyanobacterium]|nr:hypothetical protein [Pseudanabaenales cyanobacterium]